MNDLIEIAVTSDAGGQWSSCIWDPRTTTCLQSYKGGNILSTKTLQFIGKDYLIGAERLKPLLHVWPINSQEPVHGLRLVCPGRVQALSVSQDGLYCAGGIAEKLYIWLIASGKLVAVVSKHYQAITCIRFTDDGNFVITSGEDGIIMVWSLSYLIQKNCDLLSQQVAGQTDPIYSFLEHSLSVTDFYVTPGGSKGRILSVSLDRTCKIFDLKTGELLGTMVFDSALSSVVMDVLERKVYVGSILGDIYEFTINNQVKVCNFDAKNTETQFVGHTDSVDSLSISLNGQILLSGSKDGTVKFWNIESKVNLKNLDLKKCVTNAFFATASGHMFRNEFKPEILIQNFQKNLEEQTNSEFVIEVTSNNETIPDDDIISETSYNNDTSKKYTELKLVNKGLYKALTEQVLKSDNSVCSNPEEYQEIVKNYFLEYKID